MTNTSVYLDYQATTPVDSKVLEEMMPFFREKFGNPSSQGHAFGWAAQGAVEKSRGRIARAISCAPKNIIFTSGGTESNTWVIQSVAKSSAPNAHFITSSVEHPSVLKNYAELSKSGYQVTILEVDKYGMVSPETLDKAIKPETRLVSLIFGNNEIGTINPISTLGTICRKKNILFHSDAVQALGKLSVDVSKLNIDALSFSAHKIYGPKGCGAVYFSDKLLSDINPIIIGGGQECGLRSGTLNVPGIVGFGAAVEVAYSQLEHEVQHYLDMSHQFYQRLVKAIPGIKLNGHLTERLPNNLNIQIPNLTSGAIIAAAESIAVSAGSACSSSNSSISHVLKGIGLSDEEGKSSMRISFGRFTTENDIEQAADCLIDTIRKLRNEK